MVCLDGFSKITDVSAHSNIVVPDLPVFIVTLQGLLQGKKGCVSANKVDRKRQTVKET